MMGDHVLTTEQLAELLGISTNQIGKLAREGKVVKIKRGHYDLRESVQTYCRHLRAVASNKAGETEQLDLARERARLAKEQADAVAMKNGVARGELVEVAEAERQWSDTLRQVRSCMLAIPSRVRQRLSSLSVAEIEVIDSEVRTALMEAAAN